MPHAVDVNKDLVSITQTLDQVFIIKTNDLSPQKDSIHFDTRSLRMMGIRFAQKAFKEFK